MRQMADDNSPMMQAVITHTQSWAKLTANVEILQALGLADFYWPHSLTEIAFELKTDVTPSSIRSYDDLVAGMETKTHVDCQISGDGQTRSFQIKRHPQQYLDQTNEAFLEWLTKKVFRGYGDMRGTILAVSLLPAVGFAQCPLDFAALAKSLVDLKQTITFDEVVLCWNEQNRYMKLHRVYPTHKRFLVPRDHYLNRLKGRV